jgi:hypothetical protein
VEIMLHPRVDTGTPDGGVIRRTSVRVVMLELCLVAGLFLAYKFTRVLIDGSTADAFSNARRVLDVESALHLPSELGLQHLLLESDALTRLANAYYAGVHFPLTATFLVWLFVRHRSTYYRVRTRLALLTGLALVVHTLFPLAPGRMLEGAGFVDTAALYGPSVYGSPQQDSLSNQFAAMPSLHFGWALLVAISVITLTRSRWRWLWLLHPAVTLTVIVSTGNHYWLDAAVAALLLVVAGRLVAAWEGTSPRDGMRARSPQPVQASTEPAVVPGLAPTDHLSARSETLELVR